MGLFPVSLAKEQALLERMRGLGIRPEELEEEFVRSGGPGGQNVNKVSTCVLLRHVPTGIAVRCQEERSQGLNRYRARVILCDRIEAERFGKASAEQRRIEKVRRQKRRRSRRSRQRMLADKRRHSEKKAGRGPAGPGPE